LKKFQPATNIEKGVFLKLHLDTWLGYCRRIINVGYNVKRIDGYKIGSDHADDVQQVMEKVIAKGGAPWILLL
jgi:hypothetical protein